MSDDIINLDQYRQQRAEGQGKPRGRWYAEATGADSSMLEIRQGDAVLERWVFDACNLDLLLTMLQDVRRNMRQWSIKPCPVCAKRPCHAWHPGQIVQRNGGGPAYRYEGKTRRGRHRLRRMDDASLMYARGPRGARWRVIGWELL